MLLNSGMTISGSDNVECWRALRGVNRGVAHHQLKGDKEHRYAHREAQRASNVSGTKQEHRTHCLLRARTKVEKHDCGKAVRDVSEEEGSSDDVMVSTVPS